MANSCPPVFQDFCKNLENMDLSNLRRSPFASRVSRLFEIFIFCKNWNSNRSWNFSDLVFSWVSHCYKDKNIYNLDATKFHSLCYVHVFTPIFLVNDPIMLEPVLAIKFKNWTCVISQNEQNPTNTLRERSDRKSCSILLRLWVWDLTDFFNVFDLGITPELLINDRMNLQSEFRVETTQQVDQNLNSSSLQTGTRFSITPFSNVIRAILLILRDSVPSMSELYRKYRF